jgi:hypothetical protein
MATAIAPPGRTIILTADAREQHVNCFFTRADTSGEDPSGQATLR